MADPEREPLCTVKELLVFAAICIVYSTIIFSLDPEWVAWAAPMAFGGALYAQDPPPASAHLGSPGDVFLMAYLYSLASLLALALLSLVRSRRQFRWLSWLKAESENGSIAKARSYLRSRFTPTPGR